MKNCLINQAALGTGRTGITNCPNCENSSYYYTLIGEGTYDVPNTNPVVPSMIDDGIEPMEFPIPYNGKIVVEFTCNIKRLIAGIGNYENCFIGITINDVLVPASLNAITTKDLNEQFDMACQTPPMDILTGDIIKAVAGTNDSSVAKLHQILNHNMRIIYVDVT